MVVEGQRVNLKVYRRIFSPVQRIVEGETYILYSDTGMEREINYRNADYYGLDNPHNRVRLVKLAKAMNCLRCTDAGPNAKECTVTICLTRELTSTYIDESVWTPFDPGRLESMEERLRDMHRKNMWSRRVRG
ncbi:MAG TPA: hypothetical protein VMW22_01830 [Candidatus Desulfaltia sp.]|nr:hypothetical protein [Candidatus Desulfaltia sp.]